MVRFGPGNVSVNSSAIYNLTVWRHFDKFAFPGCPAAWLLQKNRKIGNSGLRK